MRHPLRRVRRPQNLTLSALFPLPLVLALGGGAPERAWLDVDGDGALDLFVANARGPETIFLRRDGQLVDATQELGLAGLELKLAAWEDFDRDGDLDLFALSARGAALYENAPTGFVEITGAAGLEHTGADLDAAWHDADGDGLPDLEVGQEGRRLLYANRGDGTFALTELVLPVAADATASSVSGSTQPAAPVATGPSRVAAPTVTTRVDSSGRPTGAQANGQSGANALISSSSPGVASPVSPQPAPASIFACVLSIVDATTGACVEVSSKPELGNLLPMSEDFFVTPEGRVGMGTSTPETSIHVTEKSAVLTLEGSVGGSTPSELRLAEGDPDTGFRLSNTGGELQVGRLGGSAPSLIIDGASGHVGVGVSAPAAPLHVFDEGVLPQMIVSGGNGPSQLVIEADANNFGEDQHASLRLTQDGGAISAVVGFQDGTNNVSIENEPGQVSLSVDSDGSVRVVDEALGEMAFELDPNVHGGGQFITFDTTGDARTALDTRNTGGGGRLRLWDANNSAPAVLLEATEGNGTGSNLEMRNDNGIISFYVDSEFNDGGGCRVEVRDSTGDDKIAMSGETGRVRVASLEVTGGSDIAEPFFIAGRDVAPGMLVAIDAQRPGGLRLAGDAYERGIVGIISGAGGIQPGLTLTQEGTIADGEHPVALSGRVWCLAETSNGAIAPGDLLTTSDVDGHAMRADDAERSFGAVVGKAMTGLDAETGLVLVWVNLQ